MAVVNPHPDDWDHLLEKWHQRVAAWRIELASCRWWEWRRRRRLRREIENGEAMKREGAKLFARLAERRAKLSEKPQASP